MEVNTLILVGLVVVLVLVIIFGKKIFLDRDSSMGTSSQNPSDSTSLPSDASLRDPITHLYNRQHLLRRLHESMARCDRSPEKMVLVLWDIDGFIEFNNRYGQREGDRFLKKVADTIRSTVRVYDEAFRSGADEFCAILLPSDEKMASEVTARVSQTVSQSLFEGDGEYAQEKFSISAGVVSYPSEHKLPEALLYAAGEALYKSKPKIDKASR